MQRAVNNSHMRAIVTGVSGQDGYYMTRRLQRAHFEVLGLTSNIARARAEFDDGLGECPRLVEFDYGRAGAINRIVEEYRPHRVFNFASKATGQGMFDAPYEIGRLNGGFVLDLLEALRRSPRREEIVLCQASSSEMYGDVSEAPQAELTPFRPKSPYGAAKLFAHHMLGIYRSIYGVRACSAILYNHESVRRSVRFVTKKIANAVALIKLGRSNSLVLGSLDAKRDWGYAPEYTDAMFQMAAADRADDYVVATGRLSSVRDLCETAFEYVGLNYRDFVHAQVGEARVAESFNLLGNPAKIRAELGWVAQKSAREIMIELVEHEINTLR
jgi:GDPmannose 4,6-dehydratase